MFEKQSWTKKDIEQFYNFLEGIKNQKKVEWTRKIINTNMPLLAIKIPVIKDIAKQISKGNFISFLQQRPFKYYDSLAICGLLIPKINDFDTMVNHLLEFSKIIDNWANCDLLKFNINSNEEKYFLLSKKLLSSKMTFERRIGVIILFEFIKKEDYLEKIFNCLNQLFDEKEYYVNMACAWLVCELFIKQRDKTLNFLKTNTLNYFVLNKAISKCRDSYRVSEQDKYMLLNFKKN